MPPERYKMQKSYNYYLTLNKEIIFVGSAKLVERKRKEYKRKGIKVTKWFTPKSQKELV